MRLGEHDELGAIRDELAGLRAELDAVRARQPLWRRGLGRLRAARRLTVVGVTALLLAVPVVVSANHDFSDVPTSSTYHTTVGRLVGAGITGGCGSGKFCPNSTVTRGQMAAFLNRGLGRGSGGAFGLETWADVTTEEDVIVAEAVLQTGGGSGGTVHVQVTGFFNAWTNEAGVCPCEIHAYLWDPDSDEASLAVFDTITDVGAPSGEPTGPYYQASLSVSHLFTAPSGDTRTYQVVARIITTTAPSTPGDPIFTGWASEIQAISVPFAGDGSNPLMPAVIGGGTPPGRGDTVNRP